MTRRGNDPDHLNTMTSEKNYTGIELNGRLYDAGLLDAFFKAANKKDRNEMIAVLMLIEFERPEAEKTVDTILKNQESTGF